MVSPEWIKFDLNGGHFKSPSKAGSSRNVMNNRLRGQSNIDLVKTSNSIDEADIQDNNQLFSKQVDKTNLYRIEQMTTRTTNLVTELKLYIRDIDF